MRIERTNAIPLKRISEERFYTLINSSISAFVEASTGLESIAPILSTGWQKHSSIDGWKGGGERGIFLRNEEGGITEETSTRDTEWDNPGG